MSYRTHEQVMTDALKGPEFRAIWEANTTKRAITKTVLGERIKRKLTQEELAHRAGLKQSSFARVESGSVLPSITTLDKIAKGLNKRLEVRFV